MDNFWSTILRKVTEIDQKKLKLICFNLALNKGLRAVAKGYHKRLALVQIMDRIQRYAHSLTLALLLYDETGHSIGLFLQYSTARAFNSSGENLSKYSRCHSV